MCVLKTEEWVVGIRHIARGVRSVNLQVRRHGWLRDRQILMRREEMRGVSDEVGSDRTSEDRESLV